MNSFFLSLTSSSARNPLRPFHALLDSGLSHNFVNESFVMYNKLLLSYLLALIPLRMFNGSSMFFVEKGANAYYIFNG